MIILVSEIDKVNVIACVVKDHLETDAFRCRAKEQTFVFESQCCFMWKDFALINKKI